MKRNNTTELDNEFTGEMESMKDFLKKKYPLLTDLGAETAVKRGYGDFLRNDLEISDENFDQNELNSVRDFARESKRAEYEYINGFRIDWVDILENGDVHYTEL